MKTKILIVDDESPIRKLLRLSLESAGYDIEEAADVQTALQQFLAVRPDFVILDLGLPDRDGLEFVQKVRSWSQVPILVLTVQEVEDTKVRALDLGADDYLTKPFSVPELLARLRVAERHAQQTQGETPILKSGPLEIDVAAHVVKVAGKEVRLTATEYAILKVLMKNLGKVVTHRHILKEVWGPNAVEHTQYIRVYLGHLRKKLESELDEQKLIMTEPGVGYRLLYLN